MGSLGSSDGFVADKTRLFNDEVLVNAFLAETVSAHSSLALVNESKAERTDQTFEVFVSVNFVVEARKVRWKPTLVN